jgi:hypothetical protein
MKRRSLARRLEHLEGRLRPADEPLVITLDYVDIDGNVVDHEDFTVNMPTANDHRQPGRYWRPWRGRK